VDVIVDESHISVNLGMNNSVNAPLELDCLAGDGAVVSASALTTSGAVISSSLVLVDCD
jgi:hypothetical protein